MPEPQPVRVLVETGATWTFATAVDWPGWSRRARHDKATQDPTPALDVLLAYADRYRAVAGAEFDPGELAVVASVPGTATTDFGAPDGRWPGDLEPLDDAECARLLGLLRRCWEAFDTVAAAAPEELRKGPRGGGRDTSAVVDHVRESERGYGRQFGVRVPPRTPWADQREALVAGLREHAGEPAATRWPVPYAVRRLAWHVLDHAWEVEDRST